MTASIANVLFSKTQQRILGLMFGQPERSFYLNEVVRYAGLGSGTVQRELLKFAEAGILTVAMQGNQKHYQANQAIPIFAELRGIVLKTFGLVDVLKAALLPWQTQLQTAFIYGSLAKGTDTATSDVDVMLIGEGLSYMSVMESLGQVELQLGRKVNPTLYTPAALQQKYDEGNAFVQRVLQQPKIMLLGDCYAFNLNSD